MCCFKNQADIKFRTDSQQQQPKQLVNNNSNIRLYIIKTKVQERQMKQKHTDHSRVSNLPLKMLFFSYFNNHESIQLMSDCHNAINDKIAKLARMIDENFEEISAIVGEDDGESITKHKSKQTHKMMEVIQEQDYWATERSNSQQQSLTERNRHLLIKKFNNMIGMLEKSSDKFGEIMFMYKNQIKEIAKDLTKEREVNGNLRREVEDRGKGGKDSRSSSVSQVKGKKTTITAPMVSKSNNSLKRPSLSNKPINIQKQAQQSQDQQARPPPKPFCQQCLTRQKQSSQRQKLQAQQKNKWRELSTKITNLKNQLSRYEQQLMGNQVEISRLNEELRKKSEDGEKAQSEEKRKIKTISTTLRGEKIVLQNQVQSLKRRLQQNMQHTTSLQSQNKKLLIEKDNLQSTIKWHTNTIEDLRNNFSSGIKQEGELLEKYNKVKEENTVLVEQIASQERYLEGFVDNLKTVEDSFRQQVEELNGRIRELEEIIGQKNQTIIRLKIGKSQGPQPNPNKQLTLSRQNRLPTKQSLTSKRETHLSGTIMNKTMKRDPLTAGYSCGNENFEDNMIKVLNKKLAIKECEIEKLRNDVEVLRAELDVYKEMG